MNGMYCIILKGMNGLVIQAETIIIQRQLNAVHPAGIGSPRFDNAVIIAVKVDSSTAGILRLITGRIHNLQQ